LKKETWEKSTSGEKVEQKGVEALKVFEKDFSQAKL
jgi:hypothetical protein|tara:strand:+ start:494 stop:601 length:108 start_codon:yes stop_codon:yes gene_type:complete